MILKDASLSCIFKFFWGDSFIFMANHMHQISLSTLKVQCIAEFIGTGLIIFFGSGCVAGLKLSGAIFSQWEISLIWGLSVAMVIYLTSAISGAHLNPAVTIAFWLFACFECRKVIPYIFAQTMGAFFGSALVYGMYHGLFIDFEKNNIISMGTTEVLNLAVIFSTYPNPHVSVGQAFLVETVITAILMGFIFALTDDGNGIPSGPLSPLLIGVFISIIGASMGPLTGIALNPARDFGPKIFAYFLGWGGIVFTGGRDIPYFLVPIFGPILGACLGSLGYRTLIAKHLP